MLYNLLNALVCALYKFLSIIHKTILIEEFLLDISSAQLISLEIIPRVVRFIRVLNLSFI